MDALHYNSCWKMSRYNKMNEQIKILSEKIRDANSIAIIAHKNPDADALCSVLAMMHLIEINFDKTAVCVYDGNIPENLEYVPLRHRIKFYGNVDLSQPFDLVILLDYGTPRHLMWASQILENARFIAEIDHHRNEEKIAQLCLDDENAAATGEIIYQIMQGLNWDADEKIYDLLAMSILTDTGFFKFVRRGDSMRIMADLVDKGVNIGRLADMLNNKPAKAVQTEAAAAASAEFFFHKRVVLATIDKKMYRNLDGRGELVLNLLGQIGGVEYIALLKQQKDNQTGISLRSRTKPVNHIAAEFGGGGHVYAAGAVVNDTLENVRTKLLDLLRRA